MNQMSSNQITGYLLYLGDEILPSDMGIILNHFKNPYESTRIQWNANSFFFRGSNVSSYTWKPTIEQTTFQLAEIWIHVGHILSLLLV